MRTLRLALCLFLAAAVVRAEDRPRVYLPAPKLVGLADTAGPAIAEAAAQAASDEGLAALGDADVKDLLAQSAKLQALGADADELSLAGLGKAVGAEWLLSVTVSRFEADSKVFARLIDVKKSAVASRRELAASEHGGDVVATVKAAARLALAPVFAGLKGTLAIRATEEGANVLVDGEQVAVTPAPTLTLTGGWHLVTVSKDSFIRFQESIRVGGGEALVKDVKLRPSPDFLRNYRALETRHRRVAWGSTLVTVPLALASGYFAWKLGQQNAETDRLTAGGEAYRQSHSADEVRGYNQQLLDSQNAATFNQNVSYATGAVAIVGAGVALYFWIFGEDPDRYAEFETPEK